ncbi:type IV pilus biogenesis/stability protein PilW [Sulfuritalea hydrogenivorans]|jgi:type IV pilus assembly protein PilF|uniref:Type IV fimbrial biogenesis protein n=1 Tax=Sulfuritalea hydrogenivorans sk43H TaxID=1223802 RepID=W0SGN8_9PROT|nr:type IV pilus biogenesis/stability protein PilW [Sulfuritalea hydrogenivorans]MDK9714364.1 type IV pilus biogenesis/stability protein PilW [Sulfuritalea sp.]BAO28858.1 Type IV fimbrial biogenesis protein [Sulfuritalea hydrogenivorans sk43H]
MNKTIAAIGLVFLLAGCTVTGGGSGKGAQQAVSAQPAANEEQQRAKVHTELGSLYMLDGRSAIALEEARIALSVDPNYAPAYNLLGLTHMVLNEAKLAEENFEKALRLAPGDPEISNNFGWFLCQNGREKDSIAYFMAAAKNPLYTTPTKPYTNAGICSLGLKDDKAAEEYLMTALRLSPTNTQALFWLADIAHRQGRHSEARQWTTDIEKMVEPTAEVIWLALRIERKLGNRDAEARYASQLRRRFPGSPEQRLLIQGQYD